MDNHVQNGAPVFVASTVNPDVHYTSPVSAQPQSYVIHQQQQQPPSSGKCKSAVDDETAAIWLGSVLLTCGAVSFAGAGVAFTFFSTFYYIGYGVWCGSMFVAAGSVAIAAGHHGTKKLIIGTAVTSCLAIAAAITQLSLSAIAFENDYYYNCYEWCGSYPYYGYCPCYYNSWEYSARAADITLMTAAALALIFGIWLFVVGCLAACRKPASFQKHPTPVQGLHHQQQQMTMGQPLSNVYYPTPTSQVVQMQVPNYPTASQTMTTSTIPNHQVVQMSAQYIPVQTMTTSTIPNQQVMQMPVQYIPFQTMTNTTNPNQQTNLMPVQYVQMQQQQQQQLIQLSHLPPSSTITPSSHVQENHGFQKDDDLLENQL